MIIAVPAAMPVTTPDTILTVAMPGELVAHPAPVVNGLGGGESLSVVDDPTQTVVIPVIGAGVWVTYAVTVEKHPVDVA